jgi:hypothetical protein
MTQKPRGKKLVYVSEEIVDAISEITRKRGESITKFVEDVLKQGVKVDSLGYTPEEIGKIIEVIQVQRVLGGTFMPLDVLNFISSSEYSSKKDGLEAKWHESGRLYGRYIKERFNDPIEIFKSFLGVMRWDLNEISYSKEGDAISLRCVSTSLGIDGTRFLSEFLIGAVEAMGFRLLKSDFMKGMIILNLVSKSEE